MTHWLRFAADGTEHFGTLENVTVTAWSGDMFADPQPTQRHYPLDAVRILTPCRPGKMIGLWNNFHERAEKEGFAASRAEPLYFLKSNNCFAAHGEPIRRPAGYAGKVVYEGELGIVIGRRASAIDEADGAGGDLRLHLRE